MKNGESVMSLDCDLRGGRLVSNAKADTCIDHPSVLNGRRHWTVEWICCPTSQVKTNAANTSMGVVNYNWNLGCVIPHPGHTVSSHNLESSFYYHICNYPLFQCKTPMQQERKSRYLCDLYHTNQIDVAKRLFVSTLTQRRRDCIAKHIGGERHAERFFR